MSLENDRHKAARRSKFLGCTVALSVLIIMVMFAIVAIVFDDLSGHVWLALFLGAAGSLGMSVFLFAVTYHSRQSDEEHQPDFTKRNRDK